MTNPEKEYNAIPSSTWYILKVDPKTFTIVSWIRLEDWHKRRHANHILKQLEQKEIEGFGYKTKNLLEQEWDKDLQRFLTRDEQKQRVQDKLYKTLKEIEPKKEFDPLANPPRSNKTSGHPYIHKEKSKPIKREPIIKDFIWNNQGCTLDDIDKELENKGVCITGYSNNTKSAIHVMKRNLLKKSLTLTIKEGKYYIK